VAVLVFVEVNYDVDDCECSINETEGECLLMYAERVNEKP